MVLMMVVVLLTLSVLTSMNVLTVSPVLILMLHVLITLVALIVHVPMDMTKYTAAKLRDPLTVFGSDYPTPDGTCIRDYIHVMDLAKAHVAALHWLGEQENACEAFNLGTGHGSSVLEVIQAFERATGVQVPHRIGPRRPGDITAIFADASKAHRTLGWTCEFSLEVALRDAWNWQCELDR